MEQFKNQFDNATLVKIAKGALISGGAATAIYILNYVALMDFGIYTAAAVGIAGILINAIKEYRKGV